MQKQNVKVVLASEYPQVRDFLKGMVEEEKGAVIIGQAGNVAKALALTRKLRPDVVVIDSYLPHVAGFDAVPLSRAGGLDTAQVIAEEIPRTQAVLLRNLNEELLFEQVLAPGKVAFFARDANGSSAPFTLLELCRDGALSTVPVFANVEVKSLVVPRQRSNTTADRALFLGGLGIAGGWFLILTIALAPIGIFFVSAGVATVLFGLAAKLFTRWWSRASAKERFEKSSQPKS